MKLSPFIIMTGFILSFFFISAEPAMAACSGRDCCVKGSAKKNKVCLLSDRYGHFNFTGVKPDGAKRQKIQVRKENKKTKSKRAKIYFLYGLAKNGKTVIKPICGHEYRILDRNIIFCPVRGSKTVKIFDWNGKELASFASLKPVTVRDHWPRAKPHELPRRSNGGLLFRGDQGEGVQTYFYEHATGQMASIGGARLIEWWEPSSVMSRSETSRPNKTIGLKAKKDVEIDGRDKNLSVFLPLKPDGTPVKLPEGVLGVFDFHDLTQNQGLGVLMADGKGGHNFTLVSAPAWEAPFQTAGKPRYTRIAVRADTTTSKYKQAPRYYVRKLSGAWAQVDLKNAENTLLAQGEDLAALDSLRVQQIADSARLKKQEEAAARQRGIEAYKQKKAREEADLAAMRARLNRCIAGVYSRANSAGWSAVPEPLLHWAIEAEYHLAKKSTHQFSNRDTGPNCSAYPSATTSAPRPLFMASDAKAYADVTAKIPGSRKGDKILRYTLAEMGKAGHSFADHRLVTLLREDLYTRKDNSAGRRQSELETYSRMARRGEGLGFAGLASHAAYGMSFQVTNEDEAFAVLENYAILRPIYERAVAAGYEPARGNIQNIDEQIARSEGFIHEGRAYRDYQARASMWRKCINPKGLEKGTIIKCPKHMVPAGMRRVYSYTPWN